MEIETRITYPSYTFSPALQLSVNSFLLGGIRERCMVFIDVLADAISVLRGIKVEGGKLIEIQEQINCFLSLLCGESSKLSEILRAICEYHGVSGRVNFNYFCVFDLVGFFEALRGDTKSISLDVELQKLNGAINNLRDFLNNFPIPVSDYILSQIASLLNQLENETLKTYNLFVALFKSLAL